MHRWLVEAETNSPGVLGSPNPVYRRVVVGIFESERPTPSLVLRAAARDCQVVDLEHGLTLIATELGSATARASVRYDVSLADGYANARKLIVRDLANEAPDVVEEEVEQPSCPFGRCQITPACSGSCQGHLHFPYF